jgi:carbon-monoxide dehydrogenase catalytic subunit
MKSKSETLPVLNNTANLTDAQLCEQVSTDEAVTVFERVREMKPCPFGQDGTCCRVCSMGPCRVTDTGDIRNAGVCGATAETIAARNFGRMVAAGASAHSDHGREVAMLFIATAKGEAPGYEIKDEQKLRMLARVYDVEVDGRDKNEIALELGEKVLAEFGNQEGELQFIKRAPEKRQELWRKLGIVPRGVDREVVEMMHRTSVGVDQDYRHLILHASRTALADGWGGSMIATELQDILFGTPMPVRAKVNLGALKQDQVNIIVHGHEPLLPEMIALAAQEEELLALAKSKEAQGINIAGICCSANEVLMRHGIPLAGSFLHQELALTTGAVETMVVDVQCIMQSLPKVAQCYHTEIVTTSEKAKIPGATHLPLHTDDAMALARDIVKKAIENYPNRGTTNIPEEPLDMVAGFSHETIRYMLGGSFRASYRPLNDNIMNGRIRGIVGVVGCNNPRVNAGYVHTTLIKELIANNVLVLTTGCGAINAARAGLLLPEAAEMAGSGLREVCEAVGIPPVLHMGSCVDNSRLLIAATEIVTEGGLGEDIYQVPAAGCAPEWMSEKAVAIGHYFVSSGVMVVFGVDFPTTGSAALSDFLFNEFEDLTGAMWVYEPDPLEMARLLIERVEAGRKALGI